MFFLSMKTKSISTNKENMHDTMHVWCYHPFDHQFKFSTLHSGIDDLTKRINCTTKTNRTKTKDDPFRLFGNTWIRWIALLRLLSFVVPPQRKEQERNELKNPNLWAWLCGMMNPQDYRRRKATRHYK